MAYPDPSTTQDDTTPLDYDLYGNPADPFSQLSSARALAMSPNGMRMPPMPASQRASQLASQVTDDSGGVWSAMPGETPDVAKDVQPAGWRTALGLAAQWFTRRHPGLGAAAANAITSTDPRVKAHQELLNQYGIANQQAQAERQNLGTMGQFGYRNAMLDNTRARIVETQQRDRQAAEDREAKAYDYQTGPRQARPISPIPPVAPLAPQPGAQLPQVTFPTLDASASLGQNAPPTVTPGASQVPPAIGTVPTPGMNIAGEQLSQARNPYTRQVETLSGPTQETLNQQKSQGAKITLEVAAAMGHPEVAGMTTQQAALAIKPDKTPEALAQEREALADKYNLQGSQRQAFVLTGKLPDETDATTKALHLALLKEQIENQANSRGDRSYSQSVRELDALSKPVDMLVQRMGRLQDTLAQRNPQADALVAPELLTVMAGGQGSGLRMNEAEIARIVGGRSAWENLKASMQHWSTNPDDARSITPDQDRMIRALIQTVASKLSQKQSAIYDAYSSVSGAQDPNVHRQAVMKARQTLTNIDAGPQSTTQPKTYLHYAVGPNNHRIGTDEDPKTATHWFDAETGKPI